jgi:hypothetical protein
VLNARNNIFSGPEEVCCVPPITGRDVPTSEYYLNNNGVHYGVSWKKIKREEIEEIEARKEV